MNKIGSLRSIKVYRNSKEIANLDVYDYLLNGKYTTNVRFGRERYDYGRPVRPVSGGSR